MTEIRHNWTVAEVKSLLEMPFLELVHKAQCIHREFFNPNEVQISSLLSIKTGSCPEDCKYCPQSAHHNTELQKENLLDLNTILEKAKIAKDSGATRFCMGAAWRDPKERDIPFLIEVIKMVKNLGLETCMTLGMLTEHQAKELKTAGLDYYNHNIDTSPEFYNQIITTRTIEDRLNTLDIVRKAGIKICSGGIVGMGESLTDRASFLKTLANLDPHPESVPINMLVKVKGTPLENAPDVSPIEFIRMIAVARILMPKSFVRLSAGRKNLSEEAQALCFMAGANSIFYGCKLLTTKNSEKSDDELLMEHLGIKTTLHNINTTPEEDTKAIYNTLHDNQADHKCFKLTNSEE
ncbi:MAG: biotin synthase BioB [Succinivibrionaceae bacterium]